jgi:peptide/nickel transport system substrate-binding protein
MALLALMVGGCNSRPDVGAVVVSAIGGSPGYADPNRGPIDTAQRLWLDSVGQGLVRFDAGGQIEAGLAERWTVIDGGMTYIFRLRAARWADGSPVTAEQAAETLRRHIAAGTRNPLAPFLTAIDDIVVMTPQVLEVRLRRPRPDLLRLFAQPELAIVPSRALAGSGPLRIVRADPLLLRPAPDPEHTDPDETRTPRAEDDVRLIGERAARAIARFAAHRSDLVTGGSFADWPLLAADGDLAPANIRVDPAAGLFGLAIADRSGFMADPGGRAAVAEAIDRPALTDAVMPGWTSTETILPDMLDAAAAPATPSWSPLPLAYRIAEARERVRAWQGGPILLRVAMPAGPGATLVYAAVAASLKRIGIDTVRVPIDQPAQLRLVDAVAPYDSARWYLATACQPCGEAAQAALDAARDAPTLADRAVRIAAADQALAQDGAFIPLARPLRWSLVSLRLREWQTNSRAWHPLNRLRNDAM